MASESNSENPVLTLTDANFEEAVLQASSHVLVDVWADWCGPCRLMAPLMEWSSQEYGGRLIVGKLASDSNPRTRDTYHVHGLPTLLLFQGGQVVVRHEGAMQQAQLKAFLDAHL